MLKVWKVGMTSLIWMASKVNRVPREYLDQQLNDVFVNCVAIRKFLEMVLISFEHL